MQRAGHQAPLRQVMYGPVKRLNNRNIVVVKLPVTCSTAVALHGLFTVHACHRRMAPGHFHARTGLSPNCIVDLYAGGSSSATVVGAHAGCICGANCDEDRASEELLP